jgi:hypothetical protein
MYSDSYATTLRVSDRLTTASSQDTRVPYGVEGAGGGFFEVPVGLGLTMRLRAPWELTLDVGARAGFGFRGSNYEGRTALPTSGYERYGTQVVGSFGADSLAVTLNGGIRFDM